MRPASLVPYNASAPAPGFIRPRACHDRLGIPGEVRAGDLFTVVIVNNLRLTFNRLTPIRGIVIQADDCRRPAAPAKASTYSAPTPR
jgi:hypothetical protein